MQASNNLNEDEKKDIKKSEEECYCKKKVTSLEKVIKKQREEIELLKREIATVKKALKR